MQTIKHLTHAEHILTDRELQVYTLFGQGKAPTEIGKALFLSPKTISTHRNNILNKMGFKNTYDLMYHAIKFNIYMNQKNGGLF